MRINEVFAPSTDRVGAAAKGVAPLVPARCPEEARRASRAVEATPPEVGQGLLLSLSGRAADLATGSARLEALKTAVREGTLEVDCRSIARALLGEHP